MRKERSPSRPTSKVHSRQRPTIRTTRSAHTAAVNGASSTRRPRPAWDTTNGSSNVTIAIVDSGISAHPDLASHLVAGHNVLDNSANATDTLGHGTEAAGVAAAVTNNATGIAGYCWTCSLMPVKVTNTSSVYMSDVATGITWAADHGAKVISLSLSSTANSSALSSAVSYAQQHGAVVVAAAGNGGCNCAAYPAALTGVVSVAGSDYNDNLYSWSSYGSWVSVAAPGQNLTTDAHGPGHRLRSGATSPRPVRRSRRLPSPVKQRLLAAVAPNATAAEARRTRSSSGVDPVAGAHQVGHGRIEHSRSVDRARRQREPRRRLRHPRRRCRRPPPRRPRRPATTTTVTVAPPTTTTVTAAPPATTTTTVAPPRRRRRPRPSRERSTARMRSEASA